MHCRPRPTAASVCPDLKCNGTRTSSSVRAIRPLSRSTPSSRRVIAATMHCARRSPACAMSLASCARSPLFQRNTVRASRRLVEPAGRWWSRHCNGSGRKRCSGGRRSSSPPAWASRAMRRWRWCHEYHNQINGRDGAECCGACMGSQHDGQPLGYLELRFARIRAKLGQTGGAGGWTSSATAVGMRAHGLPE